jgi:hypothetical protein
MGEYYNVYQHFFSKMFGLLNSATPRLANIKGIGSPHLKHTLKKQQHKTVRREKNNLATMWTKKTLKQSVIN